MPAPQRAVHGHQLQFLLSRGGGPGQNRRNQEAALEYSVGSSSGLKRHRYFQKAHTSLGVGRSRRETD